MSHRLRRHLQSSPTQVALFLALFAVTSAVTAQQTPPLPDSWKEVRKVVASNQRHGDNFGFAVAISGNTMVVGAHAAEGGSTFSGAAYVFQRNENGVKQWGEIRMLSASDAADGAQFGTRVAIDGDIIAVASPRAITEGETTGAVYIFLRDQGGPNQWGEIQRLTASDADDSDFFGAGIALDGDRLLVGASRNSDVSSSGGTAYLFERDQGGADQWGEVQRLSSSNGRAGDRFGNTVALDGDWLVIGAVSDDHAGLWTGAAYLFERGHSSPGVWGEVTRIEASDAAFNDAFGSSVGIQGDWIAIGASQDSIVTPAGPSFESGSVYLFRRDATTGAWPETRKIFPDIPDAGSTFGHTLFFDDDLLAVGAYGYGTVGNTLGAAFLFRRDQGGTDQWGQVTQISSSDGQNLDHFGSGIGLDNETLIVGAKLDRQAAASLQTGAAYVYQPFELFGDGFESASTAQWSSVVP